MRPARSSVLPAGQRDNCLLTLRHNPIGLLLSASLWRSVGYLLGYLLVSGVLFAIAVASVSVVIVLSITIVAVPLLLTGAARVIRGCAGLERNRLGLMFARPVRGSSHPQAAGSCRPAVRGWWGSALARWAEGATWRNLGYLVGLWPVLFMLDTLVLSVWGTFLEGISLPLLYSHASGVCFGDCPVQNMPGVMIGYFPHGPHWPGSHGIYVDSLPSALLVAAGCAVLLLLMTYVLVATARFQAQVAKAILGQPSDPLALARAVLTGPRPLGPLIR
jgi:putative sensor protein